MNRETELRTLALTLVEEFYENQGQGVLNNLNKRTYGNLSSDKDKVLQSIRESLSDFQDENGNEMTEEDKDMVLSFVNKEIWGYGLIDELIHDKSISDIKIHDANHIRIKREGKRESSTITFPSEESYERFVTRLLERNKVNLGTANAIQTFTDADQDDFILRLAVISGLLIVGGSPCVVIRKIPKDKYSLKELDEMGMFSDQVVKSMSEEEITDFYISEDKSEFDIEQGELDVSGIYGSKLLKEESISGIPIKIYIYEDTIYGIWTYEDYSYSYSMLGSDPDNLNIEINKIISLIR